DTLTGSAAANTLEGGGGADIINGGAGADMISGGAGSDTLNGEAGADVITGGLDNDTVNGGAAADTFVATLNDGDDSYTGDVGIDTYDLSATAAGAVVNLVTGTASSADIGADTLATIENVIGSQGNDTITSNGGQNLIDGQDGDDNISTGGGVDRLVGGLGNDTMNSGAGNDILVFAPGFGNDTVNGFDASPDGLNGQDRLDISALGITSATFEASVVVSIEATGVLVEIEGLNSILLAGVTGAGVNAVTEADFILAA
ncbi:MAG TPA: hypothetical protein VLK85_22880, partial [Ramlibacter sp.]|nr:hypothetical protein [Ramlibacter sp.]